MRAFITDVGNKLSELNIDMTDNGNLNDKGLHLNGKGILLYAKNSIDGIQRLRCKQKISKECLDHHFQIPRNNTCHDNFNGILTILITKVWIL